MAKYTDDQIRNFPKITVKIAADYLGISPMAVMVGMRNELLSIGFAIKKDNNNVISLVDGDPSLLKDEWNKIINA